MSFSKEDLIGAIIALKDVFLDKKVDFDETIAEIIRYAVKGRKEGVIALEKDAKYASEIFVVTTVLSAVSIPVLSVLAIRLLGAAKEQTSAGDI